MTSEDQSTKTKALLIVYKEQVPPTELSSHSVALAEFSCSCSEDGQFSPNYNPSSHLSHYYCRYTIASSKFETLSRDSCDDRNDLNMKRCAITTTGSSPFVLMELNQVALNMQPITSFVPTGKCPTMSVVFVKAEDGVTSTTMNVFVLPKGEKFASLFQMPSEVH